ncbi:MAG: spore coat polysaccharide biosynthesis protein SpsF [Solirubrobacteraceae bacterium]|nr:spore coat polysaccharide biosynthesis protein SpsF [Solirubrobacteraceae bacterium]
MDGADSVCAMSPTVGALAIVQARMSSSRLPGKTLADVDGEPMLALLLRRLSRAREVQSVVVATSADALDDPIVRLAQEIGVGVSRGPREDVLARFLIAIGEHDGPVVRITGDCPLTDPQLVDETIARFASLPGCAYASNVQPRTYPDGLDVEVIAAAALRAVAGDQLEAAEREHVTSAIRAQPERFPQAALIASTDLGELRWTVDEPEDLEFIRAVVRRLGDRRYQAPLAEILAAVRREPSLAALHGRRG